MNSQVLAQVQQLILFLHRENLEKKGKMKENESKVDNASFEIQTYDYLMNRNINFMMIEIIWLAKRKKKDKTTETYHIHM